MLISCFFFRLNCDSPMSDIDNKTPKGRGKRGRGSGTPINERVVINEGRKLRKNRRTSNGNPFQAPPSPAKSDMSLSGSMKRKGRPLELELSLADMKPSKRSRSSSRGMLIESPSLSLIECPEPNCNKKYKHINGLRYHQSHAHQNLMQQDDLDPSDNKDEEMADDTCEDDVASKSDVSEGQGTSGKSSTKTKDVQSKSDPGVDTESSLSQIKESASDKICDSKTLNTNSDTVKNLASNTLKKEATSLTAKECAVSSGAAFSSPTVIAVVSTSNTTVPTQVFQISTAAMGCLSGITMVSQAASHSAPVTTVHSSSPTSTPIAISTIPQSAEMQKSDTVLKIERVMEKPKCKSATRPIVPAPSPQIVALSSAVNATHSNLSPVSTHAQMSPSLKPIQPKPTIMGEPTNINPALVGLKAEKKAKQKKKSVRDKESSSKPSKDSHGKLVPTRAEHPGVIKSVPAKNLEGKKDNCLALNASKVVPEVQKLTAGGSITTGRVSPKMSDGNRPIKAGQSLLKVNSSLQVVTHENKTPISDDVQSPAYSDISDANEGCSPGQGDSPQKSKEISSAKKDEIPNPEGTVVPPHYGVYGYYGQSPYMSPGTVNSAHMSPGNIPASHMSPNAQRNVGTPQRTVTATIGSKDSPSSVSDSKKQTSVKESKKPHEREKSLEKEENKQKQETPLSQQQLQQQEYLQQQKWHQQQMYAMQTLPPHYQYLATYGYGVDPAYHMHMASDPNYQKQLAEEQKRYHQEMVGTKGDDGKMQGRRSPVDVALSPTDLSDPKSNNTVATPQRTAEKMEPKKAAKKVVEKESKDQQSLKDKQNENHQIIKENIELKSQMDKASIERGYDPYGNHRAPDKHQEELRRYYFFEQQKHMEQQRNEENLKLENSGKSESRLLETPSKLPGSKPIPVSGSSAHKIGHSDENRSGTVRKDSKDNKSKDLPKDSPISHKSGDSKTLDNKVKSDHPFDKNRSPTDSKKSHRTNVGPVGSPQTPSASPVGPSAAAPPYPGSYPPYPSYIQNPQYGQMQYDQALYNRQMIPSGVNYSSGYIHPSQMAYRIGEGDEKEKSVPQSVQSIHKPQAENSELKGGDGGHGTPFHSGHKLHELQVAEKRRPRSRNSPSTPKSSEDKQSTDKHREYSSSPPTQRHVHTHHHTHVVGAYPSIYDPYEGELK